MLLLLLLLLFLSIQPSHPNPAYRQSRTHPDDRDDSKPSEVVRQHIMGGLIHAKTREERQKRQVFDFGTNTPTPKPTNASDYDRSSGSGNALPSSDGGGGTGLDLSSFLGNRLGVNLAEDSGTSNTTEQAGNVGEIGGGEGDLSGSSGNSFVSNITEETKSEESGGVKNNMDDSLTSVDKTTLPPAKQDESSGGGSGSEHPGTGNVLGNLLGALGAWDNSTVNTPDSGQGGGGRLGGLVNASDSEASDSSGQGPLPCVGLNLCHPGYCHNGGTCFYNTTTCLVSCLCPPPFNDPELFDQGFCTPRGTLPPRLSNFTAPGDGEVTPGGVTPCTGFNMCYQGHECQHGGRCYYNTSTCLVRCLCPPPYDDPDLYDQFTCGLLPTTPPPSPSSLVTTATTTTSSGSTTTLRPLEERLCRVRYCIHGYCDHAARRCKCDPGWKGYFCDKACSKNCGENGQCMAFFNGSQVCNCFLPYTGEFCDELIPDPPKQDRSLVYWLGGSFAVGVVVLVVVGALFMFCLWRKRLAFALRVVYYFLPYEDNDGRIYDAFVSYVLEDADENFVHYDLRPKLENEMGFSLCLHQRDFPLGGTITDNILDGLENSRRFILIITPAYLRNEWAEFEFQRAFHEMLKRKISIIPIILEDISTYPEDSLNSTLKTIMESVTPLKYPGTEAEERKLLKFWKQVKLCMPKRKKVAETDRTALADHGDAAPEVPDDLVRNNHQVLDGGRNTLPVDLDVLGLYPRIAGYSCEVLIPNDNERCANGVVDVSAVVLRRDNMDAEQSV